MNNNEDGFQELREAIEQHLGDKKMPEMIDRYLNDENICGLWVMDEDGTPRKAATSSEAFKFEASGDSQIKKSPLINLMVSSVFLTVPHRKGLMNLVNFETMVHGQGNYLDGKIFRYETRAEMLKDHDKIVDDLTLALSSYGTWRNYKKRCNIPPEFNKLGRAFFKSKSDTRCLKRSLSAACALS